MSDWILRILVWLGDPEIIEGLDRKALNERHERMMKMLGLGERPKLKTYIAALEQVENGPQVRELSPQQRELLLKEVSELLHDARKDLSRLR